MKRPILWSILLVLSTGCGPSVQEQRVKYASARDESCLMDVVHSSPSDFSAESRYEHLGNITLSATDLQDPYDPRNLEQARARACRMGATAIMVLRDRSRQQSEAASIEYAAVRDRKATDTQTETQTSL